MEPTEERVNGTAAEESPVDLTFTMFEMITGFTLSQAVYVAAKLDIPTMLSQGPSAVDDLAARTGAHADNLRRILRTLASYDVVREESDDVYGLRPLGGTLVAGAPGSTRDFALMLVETQYGHFDRLLDTVRTGVTAADLYHGRPYFDWLSESPEHVALFSKAMVTSTSGMLTPLLANYRLPEGGTVADIGGADGTLLASLLADTPSRKAILFDLPEVVPAAQRLLKERGLHEQVDVVEGSFFTSVPQADVYILKNILHDWDDEKCVVILRNIARAATPGARLVVIDMIVPPGNVQHLSKKTDLIMMGTHGGKERTAAEFESLFATAGMAVDRVIPTPAYSVIEATLR